jgi:phosphoribosylanthranilate isomerase
MIIKVCGMRDADNIRAVKESGVDWMGFIFWPDSPRYVQQISSRAGIIPDYSSLTDLDTLPKRVGVFVDDMPQNIVTRVVNYQLDIVQLHGNESPVMIDNLRRTLDPDIRPGIEIMKALSISSAEDLQRYHDYVGHVDYFLFDTKTPLVGGSGKQFDWSVLDGYDGDVPFLLSGGIGPDDVERVKSLSHPKLLGIDLNSRFETAPAMKDVELLRQFVAAVREG